MIKIPKEKYEKMEEELNKLRGQMKELENDSQEDELLRQAKASLEDLKAGRIRRAA